MIDKRTLFLKDIKWNIIIYQTYEEEKIEKLMMNDCVCKVLLSATDECRGKVSRGIYLLETPQGIKWTGENK